MLDVTTAPPQRHGPLTIFPLISAADARLPYLLLSDALTSGMVRITEIGTHGSVPELIATNTADQGVLVLDGEQLVGAKQNRTTNRSLILPPHSETKIPVSCMENGRWRDSGEDFKPTKQSSPSAVRRKAKEVEARYAARAAVPQVSALSEAQGEVWSAIAEKSAHLAAHSTTGALDEIYRGRDDDIGSWVRDFPYEASQVGLLAFLGNRVLGMDVIGSTDLYGSLHERMVRGYIMDALGPQNASTGATAAEAHLFLSRVGSSRRVPSPTVGYGEYAMLSGGVIGGELSADERIVHLSAFPVTASGSEGSSRIDSPISPPSRRRRPLE